VEGQSASMQENQFVEVVERIGGGGESVGGGGEGFRGGGERVGGGGQQVLRCVLKRCRERVLHSFQM